MLSVIRARLLEIKPKINSTMKAEKIANNDICKIFVLWANISIIIEYCIMVLQVSTRIDT
jgi:hypothetical protein